MRAKVQLLRKNGRRLSDGEIRQAPFTEGQLQSHYLTPQGKRYHVLTLVSVTPDMARLLPDLYEPVFTDIGHGTIIFRGFESEGVVQEWRCRVE